MDGFLGEPLVGDVAGGAEVQAGEKIGPGLHGGITHPAIGAVDEALLVVAAVA